MDHARLFAYARYSSRSADGGRGEAFEVAAKNDGGVPRLVSGGALAREQQQSGALVFGRGSRASRCRWRVD